MTLPAQHSGLSKERWATFDLNRQILMIANEMNRCTARIRAGDDEGARRCYERVLNLADLTIAVHGRRPLRRELLRWRDVAALLYLQEDDRAENHRRALEVLLRFTPEASRQIPHLL
ncbi:MAG: hypothetical protein CME06_02650 [Gemmatimonadetes bacterium]|nr:hypothetical protein [Gemmatimonadota bacterium]